MREREKKRKIEKKNYYELKQRWHGIHFLNLIYCTLAFSLCDINT